MSDMEESTVRFGQADYAVFGIILAISASIGVYYRFTGGRQKTFKEYLLADQSMPVLPVAFSLMASFMSAITLLGVTMENYNFGTQYIFINLSYIIATPLVCYIYLPVFYRQQKTSVYEYLGCRFGQATRLYASLAFTLQITLYMGIVLYAPALALSAVTGISLTGTIIVVGLVCTFYSTLGGMKAVLITDVFQSLLMFAAIYAVVFRGIIDYGFFNIFSIANEGERMEFFEFSPHPQVRHTVWSLSLGGIFIYCSLYGVNQAQVQRLLSTRSLKHAQASLWIQWPILTLLSLSTSFAGLVIYAQYKKCDPVLDCRIAKSDQMLPLYVVETMGSYPGLAGLFVSGIFSGCLSTVSSALNSLSAVTINDYIIPYVPNDYFKDEKRITIASVVVAVMYGVVCMTIALLATQLKTGVLQISLTIFGAVGGPLLAVFTLGMLSRVANQKGATTGLTIGLVIALWLSFGSPKPASQYKPRSIEGCDLYNNSSRVFYSVINAEEKAACLTSSQAYFNAANTTTTDDDDSYNFVHELYAISYLWMAAIGFFTTYIIGYVTSLLTGGRKQLVDPSLLAFHLGEHDRPQSPTIKLCQDMEEEQVKDDLVVKNSEKTDIPLDSL